MNMAFKILGCHIIFDVKIEYFRRKARYVTQGNMTEAPRTLTYASVVSRESVRIALTHEALNVKRSGRYWDLSSVRIPARKQLLLEHFMD